MDNNTQTGENTNTSQGNTPQSEGRTFTQEDVNRIVQERLAKERNKSAQNPDLDKREEDLKKRENKIVCAERLSEKGYPKEILDILDTSDPDKFMENVEKLSSLGGIRSKDSKPIPMVVSGTPGPANKKDAELRKAFRL